MRSQTVQMGPLWLLKAEAVLFLEIAALAIFFNSLTDPARALIGDGLLILSAGLGATLVWILSSKPYRIWLLLYAATAGLGSIVHFFGSFGAADTFLLLLAFLFILDAMANIALLALSVIRRQ